MTETAIAQDTIEMATDPVPCLRPGAAGAHGDVLLLPVAVRPAGDGQPIPVGGVVAVAGQHDHVLHGHGTWHPDFRVSDLTIGVVVTTGDCWIDHQSQGGSLSGEHGTIQLAAGGCWELRGQRESAREGGWQRVSD